jgi:hypothetical protein
MDTPSADNIVLQTFDDSRYCSGLLAGRYQIFESKFYEDQYCVFDHKTQEVIRSKTSEYFMLFPSVNSAESYLGVDANSVPALTNKKAERITNRIKNSKNVKERKVSNSAPKLAAKSAPRVRGESALSCLKSYLREHPDMSDSDIADRVKKAFPDSNYNHSMVKYNRKKMGG